jgi:uncharacterized protein with GYD domain
MRRAITDGIAAMGRRREDGMPSYLSLVSWTEQGIRAVKESPQRLDAVKQGTEQAGGRLIFFYLLMGEYDLAALTEFPDDEAATRFLLSLGAQGNVRTHTMRAFTEEEYRRIISGLP